MIRTKIIATAFATAIVAASSMAAFAAEGPAVGGGAGVAGEATVPGVDVGKGNRSPGVTTGSASTSVRSSTTPNAALRDRRGERPSADEAAPAGR